MSAVLSARIRKALDSAIREQRLVGGVVVVARDGETVFRGAAGHADREAAKPMQEDSIFRYSSLTKPIVSAAAMALVERGVVRLEDPLTHWLPELSPAVSTSETVVTVRHLLTHTAGFSYGFFQDASGPYRQAEISDGLDMPGLDMDEQLRRLASVPLLYRAGESWGYSVALDVLGEILARASGLTLPRVVSCYVTDPLRMHDTSFTAPDPTRLTTPYVSGYPPRRMLDPDVVPFEAGAGVRFSPSRLFNPLSFASGGAGMAGTATDFLRFLEAIRTGGHPILSQASAHAMMSNQIGDLRINVEPTPSWGFGFGGAVLVDPALAGTPQRLGTWKWGGVYGHHWYVDPELRLGVVALTNTAFEGMAGQFATDLLHAVYQADDNPAAPRSR
jgi:CubicO group peptidase (beta-lactamase class C family)